MSKVNFTAGRVSGFQCEPGKQQAFLWDSAAPGLALRVTAAGARAYVFQGRDGEGKSLRVTIGAPLVDGSGTWSIPDARAEARRLQGQLDQGSDPRQAKAATVARDRVDREAAKVQRLRDAVTVNEAWLEYLKARKPRWSDRSYDDHVRLAAAGGEQKKRGEGKTMAGPLAALMPSKLSALDADRIASWLQVESETRPTSAALSYRLLRAFSRWCAEHPEYKAVIPSEGYRGGKVRDALQSSQAKEGDCLQREQLPAWFAAVRQIPNPVIAAYLQGLLLTGARREELAGLRWTDVDFRWKSLTIADKIENQRVVPLTPYLASLLATLPRRNAWVFSSTGAADGKLAEPRIAHVKALEVAGLPHVSLHGLRRSFGTLAEWVEVPAGVVAQVMGHKPSALAEKHYRRRPLDLLRAWHSKLEAWLLEQGGVEFKLPDGEIAEPMLRVVAGG